MRLHELFESSAMDDQEKLFKEISAEQKRLNALSTKALEAEIGKKVRHIHLGKELAIISHLEAKYGEKVVDAWSDDISTK